MQRVDKYRYTEMCIEVLIYLLVVCELMGHLFFIGTKFLAKDKKHVARQALCLSLDYNPGQPNILILFDEEAAPFSKNCWQLVGRIFNAMVFCREMLQIVQRYGQNYSKGMAITWQCDL